MKKTTPKQAHRAAETKLETLRLTAEAKAMEQRIALLESPQPVPVPWYEYPAYDTWGMPSAPYERPYLWTSPDDRSEGRYRPLYEDAFDVRRQRAEARVLCELFPVAKSALRKLTDYIIGSGWDFIVQPKKRFKKDPTATAIAFTVQAAVDKLLEYNSFVGHLDRQLHETSRIDGDAFPALYPEGNCVRIEPIDPGCIVEPANKRPLEDHLGTGHRLNGWWHGVHTVWNPAIRRDDVARPLGFHAVFDNIGDQWDYLPANRIEQIKRNVCDQARVGVSDFLPVLSDLESEAKLRRNTAVGAAILAAIVGIRQHAEGATQSTVENMVSGSATGTYQKVLSDGTSRTTQFQQVQPGTIKDIPKGMEWLVGPMGTLNSPVYIEVGQYILRIVGGIWSMPEFLITGDASNANYASTLVAESPFVKYCEGEQGAYASSFERLIWKALAILCRMNQLGGCTWQQIVAMLEINAEYASPASRDKLQQAQANQILVDAGVMSKRTWANDSGLDYDEEQQNTATEPKPAPKVVQVPGSPFGGGQKQLPFGKDEARTESLAIRAMDLLLEQSAESYKESAPPVREVIREVAVQPDNGQLIREAIEAMKSQPQQVVNHINPPKIDAPVLHVDLSSMPPPQVIVNVPEGPAPQVTVAAPNVSVASPAVTVQVPEPEDFDLEPERDASGLIKRVKRVRKKKGT
jgi:hypothetical protein